MQLTILMPCLNEAETLALCIKKANDWAVHSGIQTEVLIADNGSTDGSQAIAESLGACFMGAWLLKANGLSWVIPTIRMTSAILTLLFRSYAQILIL